MEFNLTIVVGGFSFLIDKWKNSLVCLTMLPEEFKSACDMGSGEDRLAIAGRSKQAGEEGGALSSASEPPALLPAGQDGPSRTIWIHYLANIFHYLHVNVMLISDLHQARQWIPPLAPSQLALWKIFSQLHYFY